MVASDNLTSLHEHEEALRKQSLNEILSNSDLTAHWNMVAEAMNAIFAFSHDHPHGSDDELTLQYLGIRLFNAGGLPSNWRYRDTTKKRSINCGTSSRHISLSTIFRPILRKLLSGKRPIERKRTAQFGAGAIRNALDKRDGYTSGARKHIYDLISEAASHATFNGISLTTTGPQNMAQVGPFFDKQKLSVWLLEMAMRLSHAAMMVSSNPEGDDKKLLATRIHYLAAVNDWWATYRNMTPQTALSP